MRSRSSVVGPARWPSRESPETAVELLLGRGYSACELDFESGFWLDYPGAERLGELARANDIALSVHAPLFAFPGHPDPRKSKQALGALDRVLVGPVDDDHVGALGLDRLAARGDRPLGQEDPAVQPALCGDVRDRASVVARAGGDQRLDVRVEAQRALDRPRDAQHLERGQPEPIGLVLEPDAVAAKPGPKELKDAIEAVELRVRAKV